MHKLNQADEKYSNTQITKCFFLHSTPVQASSALKSSMRTVMVIHKVKGKVQTVTCSEGTEEEQMYSSTLSLTTVLEGEGGLVG